ncbi:MAG: alpha-L-rhamnosidase [Clostridia bacterium]|nr:alpha-L-rhamnosidase [Clostridia bacterium]MBQ9749600.1 alpha-L-rhamnosidase [Clostridia bacterium]
MARIYDKFPTLLGKDPDVRTRRYLTPTRIVWSTLDEGAEITGIDNLLTPKREQITLNRSQDDRCVMANKPGKPKASILLDFGMEINGALRLMVWGAQSPDDAGTSYNPGRANVRVRLGESAMEAMTDLGVKNTTNDHANRDFVMNIGSHSAMETNESGFRFARIDLLGEESAVSFKSINAVFIFRDIEYKGSFDCSDPLLNKIWNTAAYTAHLNMQEYLWDGIKRDRLVWIGDMHTEVMSIISAFGYNEVVPKSLDLAREEAPITEKRVEWMNNMPSYSLWWILLHKEWYMAHGDKTYLAEQEEYLTKLMAHLASLVDENGVEQMPGKFLDWPNNASPEAMHAGMQGLVRLALYAGADMLEVLGNAELTAICRAAADRMVNHVPDPNGSKSAGALMVLGGIADAKKMNDELISVDGAHGYSTFLGYYILKAKALAGDIQGALDGMREYWGGMLSMGATSFWEDFNLDWMENAAPIDEIVPEGKVDIHGDRGAYCYIKFRHSLCHGWASGPCPFMTHYILGIRIEEAGCKKLRIDPQLGDLAYAKGTFPTPYGPVTVCHTREEDGTIRSDIAAPKEIEIIMG